MGIELQVTAAIIRKNCQVLLAKRKPGKHMGSKWEFPGGKIDPGETPEECLHREMDEEFGVQTEVGRQIWETRFSDPQVQLNIHVHPVALIGTPVLREHEEIRWVDPAELLRYDLVDSDRAIARQLIERRLQLP